MIVDDGAILVLGGLIEDRFEDSKTKVPLLGDIPFVGNLFRSESRTKQAHQPDGLPAPDRHAHGRKTPTSSRSTATT